MQPDRTPLSDRARGRWRGILPQLGVAAGFLKAKHGPCPMCGGKDRFRFDDKDGSGSWFCSQCGPGFGAALAMKVNGWSFREAAERIEGLIGKVEPDAAASVAAKPDAGVLNRLWTSSLRVRPDNPVGRWLQRRGLGTATTSAIRYSARLQYIDDDVVTYHPGMIAKVIDAAGKPVTLHRTYLTEDGRKADVPAPRKLMAGGVPKGAAIRLTPQASTLGVAEGIETALAATILTGVPCWATINATMLERWEPPTGVETVVVFGDNDLKFGGQAAAYALAHRLACDERLGVTTEVRLPDVVGEDWNDVLMNRGVAA